MLQRAILSKSVKVVHTSDQQASINMDLSTVARVGLSRAILPFVKVVSQAVLADTVLLSDKVRSDATGQVAVRRVGRFTITPIGY